MPWGNGLLSGSGGARAEINVQACTAAYQSDLNQGQGWKQKTFLFYLAVCDPTAESGQTFSEFLTY